MERSKVAKFPRELRNEIERMWRDGTLTLDEIREWLTRKAPGAEVSRAGLHRYLAKYKDTFERIREAQQVAAHCVQQLGENPRGEVGRLLAQMLSALALGTLNQIEGEGGKIDSKELFFLSTAIKNLASAEKTSVDRELKVRKEIAAELAKKAAPALAKLDEAAAKGGGISADTAAAIRQAIAEVEV